MNFSQALEFIKHGNKLSREGWNGRGMFLVFQKGYPEGIPINANTAEALDQPVGTVCKFQPYIMMYTAQGNFVPWLATQSDLLSDDWALVPREG
jgi:hypothetical protein